MRASVEFLLGAFALFWRALALTFAPFARPLLSFNRPLRARFFLFGASAFFGGGRLALNLRGRAAMVPFAWPWLVLSVRTRALRRFIKALPLAFACAFGPDAGLKKFK